MHKKAKPYRGLLVRHRKIIFPSKIATCHAHIRHDPLVFHVETTFQHMYRWNKEPFEIVWLLPFIAILEISSFTRWKTKKTNKQLIAILKGERKLAYPPFTQHKILTPKGFLLMHLEWLGIDYFKVLNYDKIELYGMHINLGLYVGWMRGMFICNNSLTPFWQCSISILKCWNQILVIKRVSFHVGHLPTKF